MLDSYMQCMPDVSLPDGTQPAVCFAQLKDSLKNSMLSFSVEQELSKANMGPVPHLTADVRHVLPVAVEHMILGQSVDWHLLAKQLQQPAFHADCPMITPSLHRQG